MPFSILFLYYGFGWLLKELSGAGFKKINIDKTIETKYIAFVMKITPIKPPETIEYPLANFELTKNEVVFLRGILGGGCTETSLHQFKKKRYGGQA